MSVIDRAMQELQGGGGAEPPALSVPEAIAAILVASVSVDGVLSMEESARIQSVLATSRLLRAGAAAGKSDALERAVALLNERGLDGVLRASADALPPELHPTAFAMAVDLVLCDGRVEAREKAFIDAIQAALGIDDPTALKIVEVLLIKNRA